MEGRYSRALKNPLVYLLNYRAIHVRCKFFDQFEFVQYQFFAGDFDVFPKSKILTIDFPPDK